MPSARRSASSSPSSSPAPTNTRSLSRRNGPYPLTPTRAQATQSLNGPRRCSPRTETAHRQVLADIDWWRVQSGQEPNEFGAITRAGQGDALMADTTTPSPVPIDDMENIDSGPGNDMASPQYVLTVPSPTSSTPSSRATTPPRGELRRSLGRTSSLSALEMMMMHMNRTTTDETLTLNDRTATLPTTFDASARRI